MKNTKNIQKGYLGKSRRFVRTGIFVAIFGIFGVGAILYSQAATSPSVRFVLFCATDKCKGDTSVITYRAKQVRSWYRDQLGGGHTIRLLATKKIVGDHAAGYYAKGSSSSTSMNTWNNLLKEPKLQESNVKYVVILGFHSMDHCGIGAGAYGVVDPFQGCLHNQSSVYAHELAHTWDLARTSDGHRTDGSLMDKPYACDGRTLAHCNLNSTDRSFLLNNRISWFPVPSTATAASYDSDVVPDSNTSYQDSLPSTPIYRYWSSYLGDHFYDITRDDVGRAAYTYSSYEGCEAEVYTTQGANMVPLYRYWNPTNKDHFYTVERNDAGYAYYGYQFENSFEGYVYDYNHPTEGNVPFYRYWNPTIGDHFYTTERNDAGYAYYGYQFERIEAYVPPAQADSCQP